jgi:hypothetical protein
MEGRPIHCSACGNRLDPNLQTVVYFAWGENAAEGMGPVLALCATTPEQLESGRSSPCVASALKLFQAANVKPVPATYAVWLESCLRASADSEEEVPVNLLLANRQPKLS